MKTRKPILVLVVLLVLVFMQGQAEAQFVTGNMLIGDMHEYEKRDAKVTIVEFMQSGRYQGYVAGISDATADILWRLQKNVNMGQICAIVSKYLKNHPERWNESAAILVIAALQEAFPLKK
ncbi:hypothetical protein D4S03_06450 [bacterium]|nr:MAG: hypothetical protein D4S03_06450 [bacterium]